MNAAIVKANQANDRLRELRLALIAAGFSSLDKQARVLGLPRSSTHTILQGNHKCSGLRAAQIARMLGAPGLPPAARKILLDYADAKSRGRYGHEPKRCKRFADQLDRLGIGFFKNPIRLLG